uniref:Protein farnesyltransferase/geranylgeranyltransferase type-1 subunit alpha n=1 Tax=Trichobilharzia regenti TaxID=157069 RepID=A0AA85JD88_TRIRE|nr:unnamed protein product [Trichobilharzia regenti]
MSTCGKHLFYRDRKEWNDITPVPQDDNGRHIVNIAYSEEFVDAHDYFRAVLLKNELSERTFSLTSEILLMNPANYTAWEYRRRIIKEISSDLNAELRFVGSLIEEYSKNYQWNIGLQLHVSTCFCLLLYFSPAYMLVHTVSTPLHTISSMSPLH